MLDATPDQSLRDAIGAASSYEEAAVAIARACAAATHCQICTLWRTYRDAKGERSLKLFGSHGIERPQTLAQEVVYAITPGVSPEACDGVTGYVASNAITVRADSYGDLRMRFPSHRGKMDGIQWHGKPATEMKNLLAIPVLLGGEVVGVLKLENRSSHGAFSDEEAALASSLAATAAVLCKAMLFQDDREQRVLEGPAEFAQKLLTPFNPDHLTQELVDAIAATLDAAVCSLWLKDSTGRALVHKANRGFLGAPAAVPRYELPEGPVAEGENGDRQIGGITAWVAVRRRPFWANSHEELRKHPSWKGKWDGDMWGGPEAAKSKFHSMYAVPLLWGEELLGVLKVENPKNAPGFSPADHIKCQLLGNYVALVLVTARQTQVHLVPDTAHILKSPVGQVVMNLAGIEEELASSSPDFDAMRHFIILARRAALTIEVMSRTLAVRDEQRGIDRTPTRLGRLINDCVEAVRGVTPPGVQIECDTTAVCIELPLDDAEQTWLQVVFWNLLHNAIKHSPDNGVVDLTVSCDGRETVVCVSDQGTGIPRDLRPRLFEPGARSRAKGWPEGTGHGLYSVRRLLNRLGWTCDFDCPDKGGTRFFVRIPAGWRK